MKRVIVKLLGKVGNAMLQGAEPLDLKRELARQATYKSAEYIRNKMRTVQSVTDVYAVHDCAIANARIDPGLVLEFGVYSGKTINYIASKRNWLVHGFDSFEGLPECWRDGFEKGYFKVESLPQVRANVRLHKGWFVESIPQFLSSLEDKAIPISYLHVDCDLYSSTKTIFDLLGNRIVPGTVIVFDEYFNYDGWEHGEFLAFQEFVQANSIRYDYLTYNSKHEQVAVIIRSVLPTA
ncbi:MAG: class I SAM-dependent methyltransferase [Terriglobales bacterium]